MVMELAESETTQADNRSVSARSAKRVDPKVLLAELLIDQQTLRTPVALFSTDYDSQSPQRRFSHLIPLTRPAADEQYAFEVNLDACTGCKACVAACHSMNGLDEDESWRDVGLLVGNRRQPYLQTVTSACHHCEEPACAHGCPVLAYDKDPATGIVRHLDDQCIGCSYCILKCPYDVPKFNLKRGIVRKCDMCHGRLASGEAPACVQSCPNDAIRITVVRRQGARSKEPGGEKTSERMLPGVVPNDYTRPTTRYVSAQPIPVSAKHADAARLELDEGHEPLAWMLVLTQMSAGSLLGIAIAMWLNALTMQQAMVTSAAGLAVGLIGIALSVLHLGQPLKAWRAFLGWRKSWLSREIIAFGALPLGGTAITASWFMESLAGVRWAVTATAAAATAAVWCSVMVYADTRRPFWSMSLVARKFLGTALLLGASLCSSVWSFVSLELVPIAVAAALLFRWSLSLWELSTFRAAADDEACAWHRSASILKKLCQSQFDLRAMLLVATGLLIPVLIWGGALQHWMLPISLALTFWSQIIERRYFFTACNGSKMPGN